MSQATGRTTGPLLREGLVIIASILIAFAIDAWWNTRQERDQAEAYMDALQEDFEAAKAELDRAVGLQLGIIDAADAVMSWEEEGADPARCEGLRLTLAWLSAFPTFDPPEGTVQTILSSGRADLIDDPDLLRELTRWTALVQDFRNEEERANSYLADVLLPLLQTSMDMKNVLTAGRYV
jgi:hypothetical protein